MQINCCRCRHFSTPLKWLHSSNNSRIDFVPRFTCVINQMSIGIISTLRMPRDFIGHFELCHAICVITHVTDNQNTYLTLSAQCPLMARHRYRPIYIRPRLNCITCYNSISPYGTRAIIFELWFCSRKSSHKMHHNGSCYIVLGKCDRFEKITKDVW